ncbi:MAG: TolC family protein [Gallionellaceae bacterium]
MKFIYLYVFIEIICISGAVNAAELTYVDLPQQAQVEAALASHLNVQNATTGIKIGQINQRKWSSGNYEFNLRAGTSQRKITSTGQDYKEYDFAIERPLRLPNKMLLDGDIGDEGVNHAEQVLGDAYHETGRTLLHLWFNWQREYAQLNQWQQQVEILQQQAATAEKRFKAGDAPKMELNQAQAAVSQSLVSLQQAKMRMHSAATELTRQFPSFVFPSAPAVSLPQPVTQDLAYWKKQIIGHNHELEMALSEKRIQQMLAQRGRADRVPDPTVGLRYSNEMGGDEKVTGLYISVPLSFGLRGANAQQAEYQAELSGNREANVRRRLDADINAAYSQAVESYQTWQQAREAAENLRKNAELVTRAYTLGESSLSETLTARRFALETTLAESIAQLDANETRYRLMLDAHELWSMTTHLEHSPKQ